MLERFAAGLAACLLCLGAPVTAAHHSVSLYDNEHLVVVEGTVTRVEWTSPHVFIHFESASGDGQPAEWSVELDPPVLLGRYGWRRDMVKPGDFVRFTGAPAKSGAKLMRGAIVELADGTRLRVWSRV